MENKKPVPEEQARKRPSVQGAILAAFCAMAAELIMADSMRTGDFVAASGRFAIVFLSLYTIHRFALESLYSYKPRPRDLITLTLIFICSLFVVWLGRIFSIGISTYASTSPFFNFMTPETMLYAIPYASGALLLQAVLGLHYGLVFSVSFAITLGVYTPDNPFVIPHILATSLVACRSLSKFRSRSAYLKAGFNISLIALPFALASVLVDENMLVTDITFRLLGALIGGALCAFIAAGFTPVLETLGGYVTDMRLIEMATIDHPLLKELSIQAPGTWNHSMVMGMMVEAAADAIGANAVLARVGAYFHDIGKMKKPLYFVENQGSGENRHDKLSTSMSALIIRSHVKDGIELAKKHALPEAIIDMIPQHHGTSMIEFFYDKACKEAEEAGEEPGAVDKSLYTYPGPKPQSREAGVLMLADGIEAAARTLSDPSPDRIQGMVQKMINKVFASGELSECELTLNDLHKIAKNFTRVLSSIYHQRIAYAEPAEKGAEKGNQKGTNGKKEKGSEQSKEQTKETQKKDEPVPVQTEGKTNQQTNQAENGEAAEDENEDEESKKEEDLKRLGI